MAREIKLGNKMVGDGHPAYVIAEIGINHNGDLNIAKEMINAAVHAGADAVKFQKRTPDVSTPEAQKSQMRETPWGYIPYIEYRYKVEFNEAQYREIDRHCKEKGIAWMRGRAFGTPGTGGSFGFADPDARLGYAYVMNKTDFYMFDDPREKALRDALYRALAVLGRGRSPRPESEPSEFASQVV